MNLAQFVYVIRKRIKLAPEKAIFIFVDEVLPPTGALMSTIYEEHKYASSASLSYLDVVTDVQTPLTDRDEDGFLYVVYSGENVFGDDDDFAAAAPASLEA